MIEIRNYRPADAPALRTIFSDTIRRVNVADYSEAEVEAWAAGGRDCAVWQQKMDAIAPFIAEADGEIVGYADLQQDGLIDHFFCHHNRQHYHLQHRLLTLVCRLVWGNWLYANANKQTSDFSLDYLSAIFNWQLIDDDFLWRCR